MSGEVGKHSRISRLSVLKMLGKVLLTSNPLGVGKEFIMVDGYLHATQIQQQGQWPSARLDTERLRGEKRQCSGLAGSRTLFLTQGLATRLDTVP